MASFTVTSSRRISLSVLTGTVKVLDFGLARAVEQSATSHPGKDCADSPTEPMGRPLAIPHDGRRRLGHGGVHESRAGACKSVDRRSDIFSFGCVLYEMLTGGQPFPGESVTDSLGAIIHL